MISLYLQPDRTQICFASLQKDMTLAIEKIEYDSTILNLVQAEYDDCSFAFDSLAQYFKYLKRDKRIDREDIYIVLPDYLFSFIQPIDSKIHEGKLKRIICTNSSADASRSFFYTVPITTTSPAREAKTVYAIDKAIIQRLMKAAKAAKLSLVSIEPASLSFFRAWGKWRQEMSLVELSFEQATITTYSPAGGIFSVSYDCLKEMNLYDEDGNLNPMQANAIFRDSYQQHDAICMDFYDYWDSRMPYVVATNRPGILNLEAVKERSPAKKSIQFPPFIHSCLYSDKNEGNFMPAIGTLLQGQDIQEEIFKQYHNKPVSVDFGNGNFLLIPSQGKKKKLNLCIKRKAQSLFALSNKSRILGCLSVFGCLSLCFLAYGHMLKFPPVVNFIGKHPHVVSILMLVVPFAYWGSKAFSPTISRKEDFWGITNDIKENVKTTASDDEFLSLCQQEEQQYQQIEKSLRMIAEPVFQPCVDTIQEYTKHIFSYLKEHNEQQSAGIVHMIATIYQPKLLTFLREYQEMEQNAVDTEKLHSIRNRILDVLQKMSSVLMCRYQELVSQQVNALEADITVMQQSLDEEILYHSLKQENEKKENST